MHTYVTPALVEVGEGQKAKRLLGLPDTSLAPGLWELILKITRQKTIE